MKQEVQVVGTRAEGGRRWRPPGWLLLSVLTAVLGPGILDCNNTGEQVYCEEGAAHLAACCPGFDVEEMDCGFLNGCSNLPRLSAEESRCVIRTPCATIVADHICQRVVERSRRLDASLLEDVAEDGGPADSGPITTQVCP